MRTLACFLMVLVASWNNSASAESWSGFQHGGVLSFHRAVNPPIEWNADEKIAWSVTLAGEGQSSPVVQDQLVYVTSAAGEMKEQFFVQAFDRRSGEERWRHELANSSPEEKTNYVSCAAPSPVCDAQGVIAFFEGGNLVALDPDGNLRWERDLVAERGPIEARHGLGSSLEQDEKRVFVWVERQSDPYVLAVDKKTGRTVWRSEGLNATSWSSPRLVPVGDSAHLVISGLGKIAGLDPETGAKLWTFDSISGNSTPTPVPIGGGRFLIGATVGRDESGETQSVSSNGLLQISKNEAGQFAVHYVWQAARATSSFGSPMAHAGYAYFVNRAGVVYCLDVDTGDEKYAKRAGSSNWATPIGVDQRVYLFGKDGVTTVLAAGEEFKELASNSLWSKDAASEAADDAATGEPVLYAAVAVGSDLIIRRGDRLYRIAD